MNSTDATDIPQDAFELDFEADSISGPPSPGGDLSREDRFVPGSDEDQEAPPCPEEEWVDEWADDSDAGYLMEQITEGEFLEIEEVIHCIALWSCVTMGTECLHSFSGFPKSFQFIERNQSRRRPAVSRMASAPRGHLHGFR